MLFSNKVKDTILSSNEGFTFIEVMMALCIFSIGILGVTMMQTTAISCNNTAMRTSKAVACASDQMEIILGLRYAALAGGEISDGPYTVTWTVDPALSNKKEVHVQVAWSIRGANQTINFDMIRNVKI